MASYQNITTQRGFYRKKKHIALSLEEEDCKDIIALDFMHTFLHCLSSQIYMTKSGASDVNQCFSVNLKLNQISVDIINLKNILSYL